MCAVLLRCTACVTGYNSLRHSAMKSNVRTKSMKTLERYIKEKQLPVGDHGEYVTIYKYRYIKPIGMLSRMKVSQTVLLTFVCVGAWTWNVVGDGVSQNGMICASVAAALSITVLFMIAHFSRRLIGIVWLDRTSKNVKIAHLTFWGRRRDAVYPIASLSEAGDFKEDSRNLFLKIKVRGSEQYYYYSVRRGAVVEKPNAFVHVFGRTPYNLYKLYNNL